MSAETCRVLRGGVGRAWSLMRPSVVHGVSAHAGPFCKLLDCALYDKPAQAAQQQPLCSASQAVLSHAPFLIRPGEHSSRRRRHSDRGLSSTCTVAAPGRASFSGPQSQVICRASATQGLAMLGRLATVAGFGVLLHATYATSNCESRAARSGPAGAAGAAWEPPRGAVPPCRSRRAEVDAAGFQRCPPANTAGSADRHRVVLDRWVHRPCIRGCQVVHNACAACSARAGAQHRPPRAWPALPAAGGCLLAGTLKLVVLTKGAP